MNSLENEALFAIGMTVLVVIILLYDSFKKKTNDSK